MILMMEHFILIVIMIINYQRIIFYQQIQTVQNHKYCDNAKGHTCISINNNNENTFLIASSIDGIRIWNFHSGLFLNKIEIKGELFGICLLNDNFCLVGSGDKAIKMIDLKNGRVLKSLSAHNMSVLTIKKINHPKYGECLISQGYCEDNIKLWNIKT